MKTIVLSLGGSIIVPGKIDVGFLKQFRELILKTNDKVVIICGGGKTCRNYISAAKCVTNLEKDADDWVGIMSTRLNAELVKSIFGKYAHDKVIYEFDKKIKSDKKIIIGAGWKPGCSSDMDAVLATKMFNTDTVINLSNIDYVYDKDPRKFSDAKPIKKISWKDFRKLVGDKWIAGINKPFDPVSTKKAEKLKLKVIVMKGTDINNLEDFFKGRKFKGTVIG